MVDVSRRASSDQSVKGLKKLRREDPAQADALAEMIVKNTYRTLRTRGMKGCYVYCTDAPLAEYLRSSVGQSFLGTGARDAPAEPAATASDVPLRRVSKAERDAGVVAVPVVDLNSRAKGLLLDPDAAAIAWVEPPVWVRPTPGMFVARAIAEDARIGYAAGAWCLYRSASPSVTPVAREGRDDAGGAAMVIEFLAVLPRVR
jgi:hypothetical protein